MPAARNQEVTVRRPLANRMPANSRGRRAALRRSSQWARAAKALVKNGGRYDNSMAGSSATRCGLATVIVRRGPALGHPGRPQDSPTRLHGTNYLLNFTKKVAESTEENNAQAQPRPALRGVYGASREI